MRTLPAILIHTVLAIGVNVWPARAAETVTSTISVNVRVAARTSLKVSSQVVRFNVLEPGAPATASIDFSAGVRVRSGADVVMTIESLRPLAGPDGAADVETSIAFDGNGDGLVSGRLDPESPSVAGRWRGSGLRLGRLSLPIRTNAAGTYTLPIRIVLSTP
jgi:hypothetical protein